MTENLKNEVSVHLANPSWFVAQKNGPETNLPATPAGGDGNQVFAVTLHRRRHDLKKAQLRVPPQKADPACSSFARLCVSGGQFVSSGQVIDFAGISPRKMCDAKSCARNADFPGHEPTFLGR